MSARPYLTSVKHTHLLTRASSSTYTNRLVLEMHRYDRGDLGYTFPTLTLVT